MNFPGRWYNSTLNDRARTGRNLRVSWIRQLGNGLGYCSRSTAALYGKGALELPATSLVKAGDNFI